MPADEETMKRRYREFLDLMPITLAIGGLPHSEGTFYFNTEQMEIRANTLASAFKMAKQMVREIVQA
jgi:hypothetical protein